jgi:hypothetical protein
VNRVLRTLREHGIATIERRIATIFDFDRLSRLAAGQSVRRDLSSP